MNHRKYSRACHTRKVDRHKEIAWFRCNNIKTVTICGSNSLLIHLILGIWPRAFFCYDFESARRISILWGCRWAKHDYFDGIEETHFISDWIKRFSHTVPSIYSFHGIPCYKVKGIFLSFSWEVYALLALMAEHITWRKDEEVSRDSSSSQATLYWVRDCVVNIV